MKIVIYSSSPQKSTKEGELLEEAYEKYSSSIPDIFEDYLLLWK